MDLDCLPSEITTQILSWLPIKSVFRCRSVCKPWKKTIDNHQFPHLHFTKSLQQEQEQASFGNYIKPITTFIFIPNDCHALYFVEHDQKNPYTTFKTTRIRFLRDPLPSPDSCKKLFTNGLLCFPSNEIKYDECSYVCNPITQEYIMLPKLASTSLGSFESFHFPAFGFDHSNNDYKVVKLFCSSEFKAEAHVFTLGTSSWRKLENVPQVKCCLKPKSTAVVNGSVHWLAEYDYTERKILSFSLASEKFGYVELPESCQSRAGKFQIMNLNGWLSVFNVDYERHVGVWVMKDYNVKASWTKFVIRRNQETNFMDIAPMSFWKNGEILLLGGIHDLFLYNFDTAKYTSIRLNGLPMSYYGNDRIFYHYSVYPYVGSLLPCLREERSHEETTQGSM